MKKSIIYTIIFIILVSAVCLPNLLISPQAIRNRQGFIDKAEGKVSNVIWGRITNYKGKPLEHTASIDIKILGQNGTTKERIIAYTGKNGWYQIDKGKNQEILYTVKAPFYRAKTGSIKIDQQTQLDFELSSNRADLIILFPMIFGLIIGILFIIGFGKEQGITKCYVGCVAAIWTTVVMVLTYSYSLQQQIDTLYLFNEDLAIPIFIPIFAFIGVVAYATYSMKFNFKQFFGQTTDEIRKKILMSIGHRILIAPYIAMIGYLICLRNVQNFKIVAFFSFFTGLYMPLIMEVLNQVGVKLLPEKAKQKIKEREAES